MYRIGIRLLIGASVLWIFCGAATAEESAQRSVTKGSKAYQLDSCVEPTPLMRKMHPTFLKQYRHIAVHEGVAKSKFSLAGCVACHAAKDADGKYVPVTAPEQFCESCHEYAGVELPCFSCHAAKPTSKPAIKGGDGS